MKNTKRNERSNGLEPGNRMISSLSDEQLDKVLGGRSWGDGWGEGSYWDGIGCGRETNKLRSPWGGRWSDGSYWDDTGATREPNNLKGSRDGRWDDEGCRPIRLKTTA